MTIGALPTHSQARAVLARHPIAIEAIRTAASFMKCDAEIVVFEAGRAFVVASSTGEVLQPRFQLRCEVQLLDGDGGAVSADNATACAIRVNNQVIGALTLRDCEATSQADALHALCRMVATALRDGLAGPNESSLHEAVLEGLRDAVLVLDSDMNISFANRAVGSLLSRTEAEILGKSAVELLHPDDIEPTADAISRLRAGLEVYRVVVRVERGNGGYERVEITGVDLSEHPTISGIVLSLRSAEADEELEASVERANRMSDAIVAGLHDGIVATDQFGEVTMVNSIARDMFGLDADAAPGSLGLADFALLDENGRTISHDAQAPLAGIDAAETTEVCLLSARGGLSHVLTNRRPVWDSSGELLGSVLSFHDVTEARRAADELRTQALHDQLTGLANRRQLDNRILSLSEEASELVVGACFVDLDGFKLVNDTHGHRIGDEIIRLAAKRLEHEVSDADLLIRHGGDEFVVLLIGIDGPDQAADVAESLRSTLSEPYTVGEERFDLTASIGVALSPTRDVVEPTQICIEITESSAFEAGSGGLSTLASLHKAGFQLALDDFGTGYSSLAHLRDLPLSSVKVDRSFIAKLTEEGPERAIAEAIVNLATDMGLTVVAEGVETAEQLDHARQLGFDIIQGWHYSPALSLTMVLDEWAHRTHRADPESEPADEA